MQKRRLFPPPPPRLSSEVSSAGGRLVPPGEPSSVRFSRDTCARPHSLLRFCQLGLKISLARATAELPERPHARRARARGPWKRRGCRLRGAAPWGPAPTPAVRTPCRSRPRPCPAPPSGPTAAERHGGGVGAGGGSPALTPLIMPLRLLHTQLPMTTCVLLRGVTPRPRALTVHVLSRQTPPGDGVQHGAGCGEWPRGPGVQGPGARRRGGCRRSPGKGTGAGEPSATF